MFKKKFPFQKSYSQSGEDRILRFLGTHLLQKDKLFYIDIGAYHPFTLSNTALFYEEGSNGINVEPDPISFKAFGIHRKRDKNLNAGVHKQNGTLNFYVMSEKTLSTFDESSARTYESSGGAKIEQIIPVAVYEINDFLSRYAGSKQIDFITLDVEGIDFDIISEIDFGKFRPHLFCVETINYAGGDEWIKDTRVRKYLEGQNYLHHSDTMINSIFVDANLYKTPLKYI